jgi:magnesium transporter
MPEMNANLATTISALTGAKKYKTLRDILVTIDPADIALLFNDLPMEMLPLLFRLLPKEQAADTFVEMDSDPQELLIRSFSDTELKAVIDELYVDDAVDIVEEMPANVVKRILQQADPETRKLINELLKYPDDSAGSIMTTEFVDLRPEMTAAEAILRIQRTGIDKETINTCYVTDESRRMIGIVSIRALILARAESPVTEFMQTNLISVNTLEDQETVAEKIRKYGLIAMPVVDGEERLVGIVTVDDAMDILQEEAAEDIAKMAAVTPTEEPYFKTSVFALWKSRVPWLLFLMLSATFTGMIIRSFESALSSLPVLIAYIPMLMDTGGNAGSQASVTIIRGMALGEIEFGDTIRVIWKEIRVAVVCGITLAVCNFGKLMLLDRVAPLEAAVVCTTLIAAVFFAKLVGCSLPLFARKIGFDPAVMASPLLTTIVDAISLLTYFKIATVVLKMG